ncbi:MAG: lysylphosphatidylglycerol synthase transmembrane domain-containing protein [Polyangiaceae bacterium]
MTLQASPPEPAAQRSVRIPTGKIVAILLFGVALYFAFALYGGIAKVGDELARFGWWSFIAACVLAFCNYCLRYLKWEYYLAKLDIRGVPKLDSFLMFLAGFILTITPGKVGEVFKSVVLYDLHGVPVSRTAPIVVAERLTDLVGIIFLIVVGSLGFSGGLGWAAVGAALIATLMVVVSSRRISLGILALVEKIPGAIGRLAPRLHDAYESLTILVAPKNLAVPALLSIVAWAFECVALWVVLRGFHAQVSMLASAFFYATSTLAGALAPGGLGVTEAALQAQLVDLAHVPKGVGVAAILLVRFATLWFAVIVGFIALSVLRRRHPTLFAK